MPDETASAASAVDSFLREAAAVSDPGADEHPPLRLKAGEVLSGRFAVERLAGSGGMGAVYRALDRVTGTPVALKVMTTHGKHEQRFAQEARILAELNHPAIVRYVAGGETSQGQPYLVMEWLEGEDLAHRLAASRLTVGESLDVARRVAEGLAAAHARGLVHRDVKPSNVLLVDRQPGRATLLDFGIARPELSAMGPTAAPMTGTGIVLGTVGYMSPEQAIGDKTLDARTDVFALGCVLFECLIGEPAFSGSHVVAVLAKVLRSEAPRLRTLRPELPEALDDLVARMLSKDRSARPAHGAEVLSELIALGSIAGGLPGLELRPASIGLSASEQRMTSVILAIVPGEPNGVSEVVWRHGGDMARLANGVLLVTLGGRGPASEQVVVAAACALEVLDAHPSARIVLATGRALTTAGEPPGPVIDEAASQLAVSVAPGIRLDEVTAGLLGDRFEVRQDGQRHLLIGKRADAETSRMLLGKGTPFVGRDKELALLEGTLRECVDDAVARAVLVTGPPGQGKSRLRQELVAAARARGGVRVLMARAEPVGAGSAFLLARQLVRQAAALREGEPVAVQHDKLRAYLATVCAGDHAARIAEFLGELVGAPSADRPSAPLRAARGEPQIMAEWLRRSFGEWLSAECDARPVLLVLEDLQWGDLPSLTYVGEALRTLAARPLMVLALSRPEVHEAFPGLWSGVERNELTLGRLAPRSAERLVRAVLGDVAADVVSRIVERADGNAFFLEELIRRAAEGGGDGLPETVMALVQQRLERLDPDVRRVVRAASVFGEAFWAGGVGALLGVDAQDRDAWLRVLSEREIVFAVHESRFAGEREYRFRHGLLRDAAYAMLTDADRTRGHRLAGEWLERVGEKDAVTMANHLEQGGSPRLAAPWLARAANAAYDGGNMEAALALGQRGLACEPEAELTDSLRTVVGHALAMRGDWPAAAAFGSESLKLLPVGSHKWFNHVASLLNAGTFLGDMSITIPMIQAILGVSVEPEPSGSYGVAVNAACIALQFMGQTDFAADFLERAQAVERRAADPDPVFVVWLRVTRGFLDLFAVGQIGRALANLSEARAIAERVGYAMGRVPAIAFSVLAFASAGHGPRAEAAERELRAAGVTMYSDWGALYLALAWGGTGRFSEAIAQCRTLLDRRDPFLVFVARNLLATTLARAGDDEAAVLEASALLDASQRANGADSGREALAIVALRQGRPADALTHCEAGLAAASRDGGAQSGLSLRVHRAEALHALGQTSEARAAIRDARDRIMSIAATIDDPELRTSFMTNVIHNARARELAREWLGEG